MQLRPKHAKSLFFYFTVLICMCIAAPHVQQQVLLCVSINDFPAVEESQKALASKSVFMITYMCFYNHHKLGNI